MIYIDSEDKIKAIINIAKQIRSLYDDSDVMWESIVDHELMIEYSAIMFGADEIRDLAIKITWFKQNNSLHQSQIITRKVQFLDCINYETFIETLNRVLTDRKQALKPKTDENETNR